VLQPVIPAAIAGFGLGVLGAALVARSLVRRHLAGLRAAERRARAAERMAEIGAMTGGLAHEIKNPLSTIGLNAQLLAESIEELPIDPEERGRLSRRVAALRREAERLRGILTDFLQFAGQVRIDPRPTDMNALVEELTDFFMPQARVQGVLLRCELAPGPLMASADGPHAKQALLNLMLNAVQAMAADTRPGAPARELIIRTARQTDPERRPVVAVHVIDTGPGISDEVREKIFQPYFTTKSGGTGLGLPTARRLIEAHDGRLDLHSEPGRGTDFTAYFPALPPA
jgi:signal transduction histidine kinase